MTIMPCYNIQLQERKNLKMNENLPKNQSSTSPAGADETLSSVSTLRFDLKGMRNNGHLKMSTSLMRVDGCGLLGLNRGAT